MFFTAQESNLDTIISELSESFDKAKHSRDANAALLSQYANAISLMLKQFHEYKSKHVVDVAAWHRSYRAQLDEARRETAGCASRYGRCRPTLAAPTSHYASSDASTMRTKRGLRGA